MTRGASGSKDLKTPTERTPGTPIKVGQVGGFPTIHEGTFVGGQGAMRGVKGGRCGGGGGDSREATRWPEEAGAIKVSHVPNPDCQSPVRRTLDPLRVLLRMDSKGFDVESLEASTAPIPR